MVLDGSAQLSAVAEESHDEVVETLVRIYHAISGDHPDWNDFRTAMVGDRRLVVSVRPEHAYGMLST